MRMLCQKTRQEVPRWNGFISLNEEKATNMTTIDYYPVIANPITEYKTVQECLKYAEEATNEVNQQYVITTFDLEVCKKAYPLIWNNPTRYGKPHCPDWNILSGLCLPSNAWGKDERIWYVRHLVGSGIDIIWI